MKNILKILLLGILIAGFYSCRKTYSEPNKTDEKFSVPNKTSIVPIWEMNARVELFKDPLDTNRWRTYSQYDGQTFYFNGIQLRDGYAVGKLMTVITGTPENPSGGYPDIIVNNGNDDNALFSRVFAYSRSVCVNTMSKSTRNWSTYTFTGKDLAGNTMVIVRDSLQLAGALLTDQLKDDGIEIGELNASKTTLTYTRLTFSINCLQPNKVVPIKLIAIKDENQVIHYYVSNPYFVENRIVDDAMLE